MAGLLEGEGCFTFAAHSNRQKAKPIRQLQVSCGMTDKDTIVKLHGLVGVGNVYLERRRDPRRKNAKQMYVWQASKRLEVVPLLQAIRPHMSERRGKRIDEMLQYAIDNPLIYHQPIVCGTRRSYRNGCRCAECRAVEASYARELRSRRNREKNQDQSV